MTATEYRPRGPRRNVPHFVYRCYDADDRLIYVGCTNSPLARMDGHRKGTHWFPEVVRVRHTVFPDRATGFARESAAIHLEKPKYNVKSRWRLGFSREHWDVEDYHDFMWAVIDAAGIVTPATRRVVNEVTAEASARFGVALMARWSA